MRNVTVLIKDAMMDDDYKLKVNLLIAGLMGEELDVDQEKGCRKETQRERNCKTDRECRKM